MEEKNLSVSQAKIEKSVDNMKKFLLEKNKRYGDAALNSIGIFSKFVSADNPPGMNGILIRLDDKLNRIKNSDVLRKNDVVDIDGYLNLLRVVKDWIDLDDLID